MLAGGTVKGLRLIRLLEVIPVSAARNAVGVFPRSIVIDTTEKFEAVDQILFNGMPSPSFAVFAANQLIAQVPDVLDEAIITEVVVLSSQARYSKRSLIEFGLGARIRATDGTQRLIQNFVRLLMRSPGTNIFQKTMGGGLLRHIGSNVTSRVAADITIAVSDVKRQILAAQASYSNIPANERLLSAEVVAVTEDPQNASVYCTVVVTTHDRRSSAATLVA